MLPFVPVTLDLYRSVRRHLHWTLQNLVSFADRDGKCWPSVRTLAARTGTPRTTIWRHLRQLAEDGIIARQRKPAASTATSSTVDFCPPREGCPTSAIGLSHQ